VALSVAQQYLACKLPVPTFDQDNIRVAVGVEITNAGVGRCLRNSFEWNNPKAFTAAKHVSATATPQIRRGHAAESWVNFTLIGTHDNYGLASWRGRRDALEGAPDTMLEVEADLRLLGGGSAFICSISPTSTR